MFNSMIMNLRCLRIVMSNHCRYVRYNSSTTKDCKRENWLLQFDGGSRGNPGIGGAGAVIYLLEDINENKNSSIYEMKKSEKWSGCFYLGDDITNNVAEYNGLIEGLKQALTFNIKYISIEGDSQLIINQLNGIYQVKNFKLKLLHDEATDMIKKFTKWECRYIPRELNRRADSLSNLAMDTQTTIQKMK